ncbi:MAG: SoxR reducing system RseC family protein [bacterium]
MEEIGIVIDTSGNTAQVELERNRQCKQCGMCIPSAAGQMLLIDVINPLQAKKGDKVRLALQGGNIITASLIVYGIPLLGIVCGSIAGTLILKHAASPYKFLPALGAGIGLCGGFVAGFICDQAAKKSGKYKPQIIEIIL